MAPHRLFLDPSHSYRVWFNEYRQSRKPIHGIVIAPVQSEEEIDAVNRIYLSCHSRQVDSSFLERCRTNRTIRHLFPRGEVRCEFHRPILGIYHVNAFLDTAHRITPSPLCWPPHFTL